VWTEGGPALVEIVDYDLMQRRREIERDLKTIRPRAA
jgi:hypothetical protein